MPANAKTRKKYRPKPQILNAIGHVMEGMGSVKSHESFLRTLKIRNSGAVVALMQGTATKMDMNTLVALSNMVEVLCSMGFGKEYLKVSVDGREAILRIIFRAVDKLRFIPMGVEVKAIQELLELHDQQMDVITIKELDNALAMVRKLIRQPDAIRLPKVDEKLEIGSTG